MGSIVLAPRALVIEDHTQTADLIGRYARLAGCSVRVAYCGRQGLEIAQEFLPQIVLLDIGLPDVDGGKLACTLRERLEPVKPVIIAISGQPINESNPAAPVIDHFFVKPAFRQELMELLTKLTGRHDGQA